VATAVTQPISGGQFKFAMDNGYILWSFYGKQLCTQSFETFYQLQWRPRETLLSKEETAVVMKNLKKYEKQFEKADKELSRARYLEETKGKRTLRTAFRERLARLRAIKKNQRAERAVLLGGYDSEDESNYVMKEITVESVLTVKEEVV
jgi:translation initiation factor 3 subunit B